MALLSGVRGGRTAPVVAAGALFAHHDGRVLLVHPTYKPGWDIPGGFVECDESPATACRREVREELGLDRPTGRLLAVDWAPDDEHGDRLLFVFDGGVLGDDEARLRVDGVEIDTWTWVAPVDLDGYAPQRLARRLRSALHTRAQNSDPYLEHGVGLRA